MKTLPLHGFVLAGGRSVRMGQDKAHLLFRGQPMLKTALQTLASVCEHVSIAGSRADLQTLAPVVQDHREAVGPLAGIEAGLLACNSPWALFIPVDVPLLTPSFLMAWANAVLVRPNTRASYIRNGADPHPAICLLRCDCASDVAMRIEAGESRLQTVFHALNGLWIADALDFASQADCDRWLTNINTHNDLKLAE